MPKVKCQQLIGLINANGDFMILQFPEKKEPDTIVEGLVLRATTQKKEIKTQAEQIDALVKRLELKLKDEKKLLEYFKNEKRKTL